MGVALGVNSKTTLYYSPCFCCELQLDDWVLVNGLNKEYCTNTAGKPTRKHTSGIQGIEVTGLEGRTPPAPA